MLRIIFAVALLVLVGGGLWIVASDWTGGPTEEPAVRERIAEGTTGGAAPDAGAEQPRSGDGTTDTGEMMRSDQPGETTRVPPATQSGQAEVPPAGQPLGTPTPPATAVPGRELQSTLNELLATLRGVHDPQSAGAAQQLMGDLTTRVQGYTVEGAALPAGEREAVIEVAKRTLPDLRGTAAQLRGQLYAEGLLSELDPLIADLERLTEGPG